MGVDICTVLQKEAENVGPSKANGDMYRRSFEESPSVYVRAVL